MKFVCVLSPQRLLCTGMALLAAILFEGFANECSAWLAPNAARAKTPGENYSSLPPKILASNDVNCNGGRSPETRCPVGGLFVKTPNTTPEQVFPLKQTEVKAKIKRREEALEIYEQAR